MLLLLDCGLLFRDESRCTNAQHQRAHRTLDFVDSGSRCVIHLGSTEVRVHVHKYLEPTSIVPRTKFKSVHTGLAGTGYYKVHGTGLERTSILTQHN